jgi:hypothetical protein
LYAAILMVAVFAYGLYGELAYSYDFRVLAVGVVCEQPLNNRCENEYAVANSDGTSIKLRSHRLTAFDSDDLRVGNAVKKKQFSFEAEVNGTKQYWPQATYYLAWLACGCFALVLWRFLTLKA